VHHFSTLHQNTITHVVVFIFCVLYKIEWWGAGMVICLEWGANDLRMVQLMPLPPRHFCFSKIQNGLSFWYRPTRVVLEKRPLTLQHASDYVILLSKWNSPKLTVCWRQSVCIKSWLQKVNFSVVFGIKSTFVQQFSGAILKTNLADIFKQRQCYIFTFPCSLHWYKVVKIMFTQCDWLYLLASFIAKHNTHWTVYYAFTSVHSS